MTKIKLKPTPNWLRVVRKIYTYIGGSFIVSFFAITKMTDAEQVFAIQCYLLGGWLIQLVCDMSFKVEKPEPLKPDPL